ncbi:MAG: GNAT family N-acetyltransferase [Acidobacteria bacterium]|nr:GNAT family N-acetyltransferase [Acidobacteriota bacterium]MCA1627741.1 GNAT family N-acetyltransferase [Acidobacteriota bacterium]
MTLLETERLILRELTFDDAPFILTLLNDPSFLRYINDKNVRNVEDARQYMLNGPMASYAQNGFGLYLVALKDTAVPIGLCGLLKREELPDPDLGFAFLPDYWGKGFALEAARAVMNDARERLGQNRVLAIVMPDNDASIRLLEKLGMTFDRDKDDVKVFAIDYDSTPFQTIL